MRHGLWFVAAIAAASAFDLGVVWWLRGRERQLPGRLFALVVLLHPVVGALVIGEVLAPGRDAAILLFGLHNAVAYALLPLWVLFTLAYLDRRLLTRPLVAAIAGLYAVGAPLMATNPLHGWFWTEYRYSLEPFPHVLADPSLLGLLGTAEFILFLAAIGLLFYRCTTATKASRRQLAALMVGLLVPVVLIIVVFVGRLPATQVGFTSGAADGYYVVGSAATAGLVWWAVFRERVRDVTPMARETIYEELDASVLVLDADRRVLDYNQAAVETFSALEDGVRTPVGELVPGVVSRDGEFADSFTAYGKRGPREYSVSVSTLGRDGDASGYGLVIRDVTEREEYVRDLEQQTAQLERFASTLSHDLRNPLSVALVRAKLALEDGELHHVEESVDALHRIEQLIDDLLTLAREGRTIDEPEPIRLLEVAEAAWETTETGGAQLEHAPDADVTVFADRTRLQTVLENLFANARQHAGPGATVRIGRTDDGFYVADDGPGIPPDERERVFDPEYTTDDRGTGLGLAIVRTIANAHGWSVRAEEGTDGGARFVFSGVDLVDGRDGIPDPSHEPPPPDPDLPEP